MKVSIVIPAYNEEKRIGKTLEVYSAYFENLRGKYLDYEILVVINNTQDNTEGIVKFFASKNKRIRYMNLKKGGKGYAISEGFKDALTRDNDLIGFVDADMASPPEALYDLIVDIGKSDGIIASRYVPGAIVQPKQSFIRILVSRVFNFLVRSMFLLPYKDTQCGAKLFTREAIAKVVTKLGVTQWAFDVDLLYTSHKLGFKIKEFPTIWRDIDKSKLNVKKASIQMFFAIVQLRAIRSPFRRVLRPFKYPIGFLWRLVK